MAKERSSKSPYPSLYSPKGYVSGAQYIIEFLCEKKAKKEGKELPIQFWKLPEWAQFFKSQLRKCHSLIKQYSEEGIIRALNNPKGKSTYSLHAPWILPIIAEEHAKYLDDKSKIKQVSHSREESEVKEKKAPLNKLSRLMELQQEL